MDISKMLSGEQLVAKGVTKIDATLPEIGMKDVLPNGSWLEQKQVQSALEARKHLVEVERIEKCGVLSHAVWRDDLSLAEVTQQTGGYWQYFGHHIEKKLYLKPEEALFLMEINSLLLKHNGVTVSLQKAYALLLSGTVTILQYKVYASLSRLGYKVYTHKELGIDSIKKETGQRADVSNKFTVSTDDDKSNSERNDVGRINEFKPESMAYSNKDDKTLTDNISGDTNDLIKDDLMSNTIIALNVEKSQNGCTVERLNVQSIDKNKHLNKSLSTTEDNSETYNQHEYGNKSKDISIIDDVIVVNADSEIPNNILIRKQDNNFEIMEISQYYESSLESEHDDNVTNGETDNDMLLQNLLNRKIKPSNSQNIQKYFNDIPDLFQKHTVTIHVPKEEYIPKNIFVNNTTYSLNLDTMQIKNVRSISNEQTYNASDEVNESLRRIRNSSRYDTSQFNSGHLFFANMRYPRMNQQFPRFNYWRPRNHLNYCQFMFYQRPVLPNCFIPRFTFTHRMNNFLRQFPNSGNWNSNNVVVGSTRKRTRDEKSCHLKHIKIVASRFKQMVLMGNRNTFIIQSLQRLIFSYNAKFRCRLRLTDDFEIVDDSAVLETIELEEEEGESNKKKPKLEIDTFKDNLSKIRVMALRLKEIEEKNFATSRPRRAFCNAIRAFNKSYNADVYLSINYEVIDRRHITLDSSSDSDCVLRESKKSKTKKLRNPFSVLKTISKTIQTEQPSTSNTHSIVIEDRNRCIADQTNKDPRLEAFDKNWLPKTDDDFGRREVVKKQDMDTRIIETYKDELLYDFMKNNPKRYDSWLNAKIAFAKYIESTKRQFRKNQNSIEDMMSRNEKGLTPIIGADDCTDTPSVLNKLRIIQTDMEVNSNSRLRVDFDVYNRDVQNFRKSNRPKPHFRIICMNESSSFPSGEDLLGLQSKYKDGVAIVFAIVSISSISYLQINPTDLPLYIPCRDLT